MYVHVKETVKLNDGAKVVDDNNLNASVRIANDRIVWKFLELDNSLIFFQRSCEAVYRTRVGNRELVSEGQPAVAGDDQQFKSSVKSL